MGKGGDQRGRVSRVGLPGLDREEWRTTPSLAFPPTNATTGPRSEMPGGHFACAIVVVWGSAAESTAGPANKGRVELQISFQVVGCWAGCWEWYSGPSWRLDFVRWAEGKRTKK